MQTKTVKLKMNDAGVVALAPPGYAPRLPHRPGRFCGRHRACAHPSPPAAVLTAYRTAAVDVSFDAPYRIAWEDLAGTRPGQIVRTRSGRAAQRLIAAGGSERSAQYIPRRRS